MMGDCEDKTANGYDQAEIPSGFGLGYWETYSVRDGTRYEE